MILDPGLPREKTQRGSRFQDPARPPVAPGSGLGLGPGPPRIPRTGPRGDMGWVKYSKLKAKKDLSIPTRPP